MEENNSKGQKKINLPPLKMEENNSKGQKKINLPL
jgi:hypothetical protein